MSHNTQTDWPSIGPQIPRRGNGLTRALSRALFRLTGWRIGGSSPMEPKMVLVGAPHTSNWDFVLAMGAMFALGVRFSWVVKHTVAPKPLRPLVEWLGGIPLNREKTVGFVDQMASEFEKRETLLLAIMPEGTRSKTAGWKSGFYYIADQAEVPIFPVVLDYNNKEIRLGPEFYTTGDLDADLPKIQAFYADGSGRWPA